MAARVVHRQASSRTQSGALPAPQVSLPDSFVATMHRASGAVKPGTRKGPAAPPYRPVPLHFGNRPAAKRRPGGLGAGVSNM